MDSEARARAMSLIPYVPDNLQVILRHESTVVLYDEQSKQLSLRSVELQECPACHRPFQGDSASADRSEAPSATYMNPSYFSMLRRSIPGTPSSSRQSSPRRRLAAASVEDEEPTLQAPAGAEFVASEPRVPSKGISSSSFSPNYFKTFFREERELGRGGKGVVLLVNHFLDRCSLGQFACKRVPVGNDHDWLEKVLIEVQTLQHLSHANLVSYKHVWLEDYKINKFGPSVPCAFILQQYCNAGDLHHYVLQTTPAAQPTPDQLKDRLRRRSKGLSDRPNESPGPRHIPFDDIFSFFRDITSGLHHLHSHGFIHRDIKPSNCLLHVHTIGRRPRVLLSDFGEVQVSSASRMGTGATGTVSYCAPEVLRPADPGGTGFGNFSVKSDVFSVGMMVHFMCFGALPYSSAEAINADVEDVEALRAEIVAWRGFDAAAAPARGGRLDLPDRLYSFLKTLLALDPDDRPSTEDILRGIGAGVAGADEDELAPQFAGRDTRNPRTANPSFAPPGAARHSSPSKSPLRTHRHHTHVHAVEDGELDFEDDEPRSPKEPGTDDAAATAVVRRRHRTGSNHNHGSTSPRPPALPLSPAAPPHSPILALPPPPATLRQRLRAALLPPHAAARQQPLLRLALFAAKYLSLTAPCAPLAPRPRLAYPLLVLAAAEAVLRVPWRWAAVALAVHVAVLAVVGGSGAGLCAWGVGGM